MTGTRRNTSKMQTLRRRLMTQWAQEQRPCCRCGLPIDYTLDGRRRDGPTLDHLDPVAIYGVEGHADERLAPAHLRCNASAGSAVRRRNQKKQKQTRTTTTPAFLQGHRPDPRPPVVSLSPPESDDLAGIGPVFDDVVGIVPWLADLAVAADGGDVPPRLMTSAHPTATGTYGPAFVRWVDGQPQLHPRKTQGLLWWQRLVAYRALEHDADGALVWRNVLLTVSRQSGKSWLLRSLIAWRIAHADLFGELQQVLHVAHKLDAAAHVWEPAAHWAQTQPG